MTLLVNGNQQSVPDGVTVADLIRELGLGKAACAAEVNRELVPRRDQSTTTLKDGDRVELVTLVGGG